VAPDAFTHVGAAQGGCRVKKGLETGDLRQGDTFHAPALNGFQNRLTPG